MARFRAVIEGRNGGQASRLGSTASGVRTHAAGWEVGVRVESIGDPDRDVFEVSVTHGSSPAGERARVVGRVALNAKGEPVFTAARVSLGGV